MADSPRHKHRFVSQLALLLVATSALSLAAGRELPRLGPNRNKLARVTDVHLETAPDYLRIVVRFDRKVAYQSDRAQNPERIFFDLQGTEVSPELNGQSIAVSRGSLRRIRLRQHESNTVRLVLDMDGPVPYSASFLLDPPRLVVEIPLRAATHAVAKAASPSAQVAVQQSAGAEKERTAPRPLAEVTVPPALPVENRRLPELAASTPPLLSAIQPPTTTGPDRITGTGFDLERQAPPDPVAAAQWYRKLAEQGNIEAEFRLGSMYFNGRGVLRNRAEAAIWYGRAAFKGHAAAQANLGVLFANGWGIARDDAEAVKWFRAAAEQGDPGGQSNLGAMYLAGRGVRRDATEAAKWLRKAADAGIAEAEYGLGTLYTNGRGVTQDNAEAVKWLRKAAQQSYAPALLALGKMYLAGRGVAQDYAQAAGYLIKSAEQGVPEAQYQLAFSYRQGWGVPRNEQVAMNWLRRAAETGSADAQYALGELYRDGQAGPADFVAAYAWFALSAANGNDAAKNALNSIAPRMSINQIADAQRRALAMASQFPQPQSGDSPHMQ
jgi:uncharacterized protein